MGRTAARIGEQLESLHQKRSTAQATSLIVSYYLSLVHQTSTTGEEPSPLDALYATRTSRDGRARIAVVLRRLMSVAKDMADSAALVLADAEAIDAKEGGGTHTQLHRNVLYRRGQQEKADRVRDEVQKYCDMFELDVRSIFDKAYKRGEPRMMAHCAQVLQDFNGGSSIIQIYVNQHDFFISKDKLLEEAGTKGADDFWKNIGDPDVPPPTSEPGLEALFKEIRETASQEAQIVRAVFPNPIAVMQVFLQRVFAQVVQQHIEMLVSRAAALSTLASLRILHLSHTMCTTLVEDLKTYDVTLGGPGVGSSSKLDVNSGGPLSTLLDQSLEEMYVPWLEGSRYLDSESKNLAELYGGLLSRFTRYHETVLKAKPNSLLDRVVNSMSTSAPNAVAPTSTAHAAAAAARKYANLFTTSVNTAATSAFSSGPGSRPTAPARSTARLSIQSPQSLSRSDSQNRTTDGPVEEKMFPADGLVTIPMAERMLRWHAEAVGRVVELSPSADVAKNISALSNVLAEAVGRSFIETALDSALARLDQSDARTEPDLTILQVLRPADLVCHLWQRYANTALVPLTSSNAAMRREVTTFNQHNVVRMEGKINSVIQKAIDTLVVWLSFLLAKQKRNDYKPKDDVMSFTRTNTEPCELCVEFLGSVQDTVGENMSGKNSEHFLTEIGVAFHSLLLDHYKKFPVNPTGGLMLTTDIAAYQEAIKEFGIPALNDRFEMLRQLGNSFVVQPQILRSYMTESHLGRIDARLLRPYLQQRSDWSQFSRSLALDDGVDDTPVSGTATPASSMLQLRASKRLSAMSGVAGAGYARLREALRDFETLTDSEKKISSSSSSSFGTATGNGNAAGTAPPSAFGSRAASGNTTPAPQAPPRKHYPPPMSGMMYMSGMH